MINSRLRVYSLGQRERDPFNLMTNLFRIREESVIHSVAVACRFASADVRAARYQLVSSNFSYMLTLFYYSRLSLSAYEIKKKSQFERSFILLGQEFMLL